MTKTKSRFRGLMLALVLLCATPLVQAQGGPGDDPDPPRAVPFDGGLSLVVAAGIAYAVKKGRDKRKKQNEQQQTEK